MEITIANDAPLKYIELDGHNLHPSCLEAIHRIIERNGGEITGEFENEDNDEDLETKGNTEIRPRTVLEHHDDG